VTIPASCDNRRFELVGTRVETASVTTDQESRVRFPGTIKKSSGSGTGSTQPREYNRGAT
jgi:hypothetical protein